MGFSRSWSGPIARGRRALTVALFFAALHTASALVSAPPLLGLAPPNSRERVIRAAETYLGVPYRLGGTSKSGIDCSGLVYSSFLQGTGFRVPRTVDTLATWVLVIPSSSLAPGDLLFFDLEAKAANPPAAPSSLPAQTIASLTRADHVGIYLGDELFIHAASAGLNTGVTQNSLADPNWRRRLLFAGRALPEASLSGLALDAGLGVNLSQLSDISGGLDAIIRGVSGWGEISLPILKNFSLGLRAGVAWDRSLGTIRAPLELDIGQISGIAAFAGPALTFGNPVLGSRGYAPAASILGTIGLRWSPIVFSSGASRYGSYFEIRYDNFTALPGQSEAAATDLKACISFTIGVRFRSLRY